MDAIFQSLLMRVLCLLGLICICAPALGQSADVKEARPPAPAAEVASPHASEPAEAPAAEMSADTPTPSSDAPEDAPAPAALPAEAYTEEALRRSAERARALTDRQGIEWPGYKSGTAAPPLSAETQSRLVLERMAAAKDPGVRLRALEGWVVASAWDTVDVLIAALADPNPAVAEYAAQALAQLAAEHDEAVGLLHRYYLDRMLSQNQRLRAAIQRALPTLKPVLEAPMLITLQAEAEEPARRAAAAFCLGEMSSVDAIPALSRTAWSDDPLLARTSAQSLLKLRHPRTVETWLRLLNHGQVPVRMTAVEALSALGGDAAAAALVETALGTARDEVDLRLFATRSLARWPLYESVPLLISVLEGPPGVRRLAHNILQSRTGRQAQADPESWQRWWQEYGRFGVKGPEEEPLGVRPKPVFDLETWGDPAAGPIAGGDGQRRGLLQRLGFGGRDEAETQAHESAP